MIPSHEPHLALAGRNLAKREPEGIIHEMEKDKPPKHKLQPLIFEMKDVSRC